MMKRTAMLCLLAALVLALCGCSTEQAALTGTWRMDGPVEGTLDVYLTFGEDGTLTARYNSVTETAAYRQEGEDGLLINDELFRYTIQGSGMTMSYSKLKGAEKDAVETVTYTMDDSTVTFKDTTYAWALDESGKLLTLTDGDTVTTYSQSSKRSDITTGTWTIKSAEQGGVALGARGMSDTGMPYSIRLKKAKDGETAEAVLTPIVLIDTELKFTKTTLPEQTEAPAPAEEAPAEAAGTQETVE